MKNKKRWLILGLIALALLGLLAGLWAGLESRYQAALKQADPRQALPLFEKLGPYRDSSQRVETLRWEITRLDSEEAESILAQVQTLSAQYDYASAAALLESYPGDRTLHPEIDQAIQALAEQEAALVLWEEPALSLGVQTLIADPERAYADPVLGSVLEDDYLTVEEFSQTLTRLYEGGYVLVTPAHMEAGVRLPQGKSPLLLAQLGLNYYTYLVDSDGDREPDKNGKGFAHRLEVTADGTLTCAYVDAQGNAQTGAYDLVPILDAFVEEHPDFSYQGDKALLAVTGYDGLFGYRTDPETAAIFGTEYYENQCWGAYRTAQTLTKNGYTLACLTYGNLPCGTASPENMRHDLALWEQYVTPILGQLSVFVCPQCQDASQDNRSILQEAGFQILLTCGRETGDLLLLTPSTLEQLLK